MTGRFLTAEWRHLAMLNYRIDPAILRPLVPRGTELDDRGGELFVSVVGFLFLRTRLLGIPVPFHQDFEEVNLRFYVRREVKGELRRGVVFVKELVPRRAIAWVARTVYNEAYVALPMRHQLPGPGGSEVVYEWRTGERWNRLSLEPAPQPAEAGPASPERFITEHYWGYAAQRDGGTVEYQVEHPLWNVFRAQRAALDVDVAGLYGEQFVPVLSGPPASAFLADGSAIVVRRGTRIA